MMLSHAPRARSDLIVLMLEAKSISRSISWWVAALMLPGIAHSFGKYDSRNGDECRAQVNANYDALAAEMKANGNLRGIAVMNRRSRAIDLAECAQMDQRARESKMVKAYQRLSAAIETLKARQSISADERRVVAADHETILKFPPAPYREAYLRLHADYLRYEAVAPGPASSVAGTTQVFRCTGAGGRVEFSQSPCQAGVTQAEIAVQAPDVGASPSWAQCEAFKTRIESAKNEHDTAVTALLPRKAADGEVRGDWKALEDRRLTALSQWQWQRDRARAAGCSAQ